MDDSLEPLFRALADPTRREILLRLARGPLPVNQVAAAFAATRPAISRHLRVLREAGLVREQRRGRERVYELEGRPLAEVTGWLASLDGGGGVQGLRGVDRRLSSRATGVARQRGTSGSENGVDWAAWLGR